MKVVEQKNLASVCSHPLAFCLEKGLFRLVVEGLWPSGPHEEGFANCSDISMLTHDSLVK